MPALGATQLDVKEAPTVTGPLALSNPKCYSRLARDPLTDQNPKDGTNKDETVMGRVRLCTWLIKYNSEKESDAARDYGVAWVQTTIDARNGYCVGRANTKLRIPYSAMTYGVTPKNDSQVTTPTRRHVQLFLNASGHGAAATVSQDFWQYPNKLLALTRQTDKGKLFISRYLGRAKDNQKLGFAEGVKMSWVASDGAPTYLPRLKYNFIIPNKHTNRTCG
jgi:hypothetical protein